MNAVTKPQALEPEIMEMVLADGDLSRLSTEQRLAYYARVCETQGLNPLTRPFDYVKLNGKLVLYAKRECTDQKRKLDGVSIQIVDKRVEGDLFIVTARATNAAGRVDEDMGAVSIAGLRGEALANATLKAMTKAKRRVTLSICGMGMLDESEVESVQQQEREVQSTVLRDEAKRLPPKPEPRPVQSRPALEPTSLRDLSPKPVPTRAEIDTILQGDTIPALDPEPAVDKAQVGVQALEAQIRAAATEEELHQIAGSPKVEQQRAWLAKHRPELDELVAGALGERYQQLVQARLEAETEDPSLMLDRPTEAATA